MTDHRKVQVQQPALAADVPQGIGGGRCRADGSRLRTFAGKARASDWSGETLRFMIINPHAGSIKPLSEGFNELTGATVEGVKVPYDQITAQSTLDVMSGTNEIDVFQYWYVDKEALVRDGVLADITDRIAAEEADIDPADFLGALYDSYTLVDGRRYGLPTTATPTSSSTTRRSWTGTGSRRRPRGTSTTLSPRRSPKQNPPTASTARCSCASSSRSSSARPTRTGWAATAATSSTPTARRRSPAIAAIGAAQTMLDAGPSAVPTPLETEFGNSIPVFLSGGAAMIEFWTDLGTWAQDANQSQIVDKWGVVPMPVAGDNTVNRPAMNAGWSFGVSSGSHNPEMAWEFVRMSSSKDFHVRVLTDNTTGVDPTRRSAMPAYRDFAPLQADAVEQAIDDAFPWPTKPESPKLMQSLTDELGLMMAGDKTAEQAMADAQASWEDILS